MTGNIPPVLWHPLLLRSRGQFLRLDRRHFSHIDACHRISGNFQVRLREYSHAMQGLFNAASCLPALNGRAVEGLLQNKLVSRVGRNGRNNRERVKAVSGSLVLCLQGPPRPPSVAAGREGCPRLCTTAAGLVTLSSIDSFSTRGTRRAYISWEDTHICLRAAVYAALQLSGERALYSCHANRALTICPPGARSCEFAGECEIAGGEVLPAYKERGWGNKVVSCTSAVRS